MMKTSSKIALVTILLSILGVATITKLTYALPNHTSIKVAEAEDGGSKVNDDTEEQQEASQLQRLSKISSQQAGQAAQQEIGGQPDRVKLDNEGGNLVYTVEIGQTEVKVDAGNGRILYVEKPNQEDNEASETSHPRSSIQVPNSLDNDQEINDDRESIN